MGVINKFDAEVRGMLKRMKLLFDGLPQEDRARKLRGWEHWRHISGDPENPSVVRAAYDLYRDTNRPPSRAEVPEQEEHQRRPRS